MIFYTTQVYVANHHQATIAYILLFSSWRLIIRLLLALGIYIIYERKEYIYI